MSGLRSRVVLITGAASYIGRATALSFAKCGSKLGLVDMTNNNGDLNSSLTSKRLEKISDECKHLGAADIHMVQCDLNKREDCRSALEDIVNRFRDNLNVLINISAIITHTNNSSASVDDENDFEKILTINMMTALRFSQLSVPYLAKASTKSSTSGAIINVNGPDIAIAPGAALTHRFSQGATNILTSQLAVSLAPKGIRVNAVLAGGNLNLKGGNSTNSNVLLRHSDFSLADSENESNPSVSAIHHVGLSKMGNAHNIATAIKFLASDDASFITGETLFVDGGASLK